MPSEFKHIPVARNLCERYRFKTVDKIIYRYDESGVFLPDGRSFIESEAQHTLGNKASSHIITEVVNWIARETQANGDEFDTQASIINCRNGLMDVITPTLREHTPAYPSLVQIPVVYEPAAVCPLINRFLHDILKSEDIPVIEELFGYCLYRQYPIQKAFLLVGEGSNGKSTVIELLRAFLGKNNCSSLTFQDLEEDRFARADLHMKLANLSSDIPSRGIQHIGLFKRLTGGDEITADRKFRERIQFVNYAKLVFSANRPPKILNDDSYAFWRRWVIIGFPNQFTDKADRHLLHKLAQPNELSGLLNLALAGLQRLLTRGEFSTHASSEEVAHRYQTLADPVLAFAQERCELNPEYVTEKEELYQAFSEYCTARSIPLISKESFGRNIRNSQSLQLGSTRTRSNGNRPYAWKGIALK